MLSSVLNSDRAIAVNIEITRSFVRIRKLLEADKLLARKFARLGTKANVSLSRSSGSSRTDSPIDESTGAQSDAESGSTADLAE